MSFLSEKRHKYSNFYNTNKEYYLWFEDFPTPAFLRFSSVDMYISTKYFNFAVRRDGVPHPTHNKCRDSPAPYSDLNK